jgi:CRISPR-associated protein Cmr2
VSHLLAVSIGPVQEWIAAARRTRDLWFGSLVLSEISKAAAREIEKEGKLIFPAEVPEDGGAIANIILAEVESANRADALQRAAREAAEYAWLKYANGAKERVKKYIDGDLWDEQAKDVIEFYAAWVPLAEYKSSRHNAMRLLAGRKACRNFLPVQGRRGVPKSSLDGARESVWRKNFDPEDLSTELAIALRLSSGEHLDCVGLTKRLGANHAFPSVSRIAADPWIQSLSENETAQLRKQCEQIGERTLGVVRGDRYQDFPFEGDAVYRNRYPQIEEERKAHQGALRDLAKTIKRLEEQYGIPSPYLAVLIADGDRMGEAISKIESADLHRDFSGRLGNFAKQAGNIVEEHRGSLVYAGGDDVLAFLPLNLVLICARRLHDAFGACVPEGTLSVGIAIGHSMEPMEDLLGYARDAERRSKQPDRNGLAVHFHSRSGEPVSIRRSWQSGPDERLEQWSEMFGNRMISSKAAYDVRELAQDYKNWPDGSAAGETIQRDALRLLSRKELSQEGRNLLQRNLKSVTSCQELNDLADELLIAHSIASAKPRGEGARA